MVIIELPVIRFMGWVFFMIPAAISIGMGLELTDTPWYSMIILFPFMYIYEYRGYLGGTLICREQKAILTVFGAYFLRIVFVISSLIIYFKYL